MSWRVVEKAFDVYKKKILQVFEPLLCNQGANLEQKFMSKTEPFPNPTELD